MPADATVPVRIELDDDFGLHSSRLIYKMATGESEPHEAVAIPLWSAPADETAPGRPALVKHQEIATNGSSRRSKLAVGSIITFYADARDFDSIKGPNLGKSREIRLRIVSKEDAARQFDDAAASSARRSRGSWPCRSRRSLPSMRRSARSRRPIGCPSRNETT